MKKLLYPTVERVIACNYRILTEIKVKKADRPELLSHRKLANALDDAKKLEGDLYDKAALLLKDLVQAHAFASGNRRTAFLITKDFLFENGGKFAIRDDPKNARVLQGVRKGFYTQEELKEWIKHGKIREFKR